MPTLHFIAFLSVNEDILNNSSPVLGFYCQLI